MSVDSMQPRTERTGSLSARRGSSTSVNVSTESHTNLSGSTRSSQSRMSSAKGKMPFFSQLTKEPVFLSIIFDREDCLLPVELDSQEANDASDANINTVLDPRLLGRRVNFEGATSSTSSPAQFSSTRASSSQKDDSTRSGYATHLRGRQPMFNTLRLHLNFDLHNVFGTLPTFGSGGIEIPMQDQEARMKKLFVPTWAMMTLNTKRDPGSLHYAFTGILQDAAGMMDSGAPVEAVIETHPNIAALFNEEDFKRSGLLSQWAASMVHSMELKGKTARLQHDTR